MSPVLQTFLAGLIVWFFLAVGSAAVFKKNIPLKPLIFVYGLASGVILAAVFFSLLGPSIEAALSLDQFPLIPSGIGFILGCLFVNLIERSMPDDNGVWFAGFKTKKSNIAHEALRQSLVMSDIPLLEPEEPEYHRMGSINNSDGGKGTGTGSGTHSHLPPVIPEGGKSSLPFGMTRRTLLLMTAMFFHHIPEGIAMGVAFGAVAGEVENGLAEEKKALREAMVLTLGLCISAIPEGLAVALPLRKEGLPAWKAWALSSFSGLPTMVGGFIGVAAVSGIQVLLPWALAFAAGAMIYVVVREMLPEAMSLGDVDLATLGFIFGFVFLMSMDVIFES